MYLKKIIARNLQNYREVTIDFPPTGLIALCGQNSNGKSVIVRATTTLISGLLSRPRKRTALVNYNASFAEILYVRDDNTVLTAHIAREANLTYVKLEEPGKEPVARYLADKSYLNLVYQFGWHYDKETGISLNMAESLDSLLFYKTSFKTNGSVLRSATSDERADIALEGFKETVKTARNLKDTYVTQASTFMSALKDLKVEPIEPLLDKKNKLEACLKVLSGVYFPKLPEIVPPVTVHFTEPYRARLPIVKYPRIVSIKCNVPDMIQVAEELNTLKEHKCPMCGRGFDCAC